MSSTSFLPIMETATTGSIATAAATIAGHGAECKTRFHACLESAAKIHGREFSLVEDQLARFNIWAANLKVFARPRECLDHRLREAPEVQDLVIIGLEGVQYFLNECLKRLNSYDLVSFHSQLQQSALPPVDEELSEGLRDISTRVTGLHRFSNIIFKASRAIHNHKAADEFKLRDEEGNDTEPFLRQLFIRYITDRFPGVSDTIRDRLVDTMILRRKRILYRRARYGKTSIRTQKTPIPPEPEPEPVPVQLQAAPPLNINNAVQHENTPTQSRVPLVDTKDNQSAVLSTAQTATTLSPENFKRAAAQSVISVSKTVALGGHEELRFPQAPSGNLMRRFNKLEAQETDWFISERDKLLEEHGGIMEVEFTTVNILDFQDDLRVFSREYDRRVETHWRECVEAVGEITCPFCFYALPAQDVADEKKWRLHVLSDLDPYVCLFETCEGKNELFAHSSAWLKHMREHCRTWRCRSKTHPPFNAQTREEYLDHMEKTHPGKLRKLRSADLEFLADNPGRFSGPLFSSCPLCGNDSETMEGGKDKMESHVVGHLRSLALHSLPTYEPVDTGGLSGSEDSQARSESHVRPRSSWSTASGDYNFDIEHTNTLSNTTLEPDIDDVHPSPLEGNQVVPESLATLSPSEMRLCEWGFVTTLDAQSQDSGEDDPVLNHIRKAAQAKAPGTESEPRQTWLRRMIKSFNRKGV